VCPSEALPRDEHFIPAHTNFSFLYCTHTLHLALTTLTTTTNIHKGTPLSASSSLQWWATLNRDWYHVDFGNGISSMLSTPSLSFSPRPRTIRLTSIRYFPAFPLLPTLEEWGISQQSLLAMSHEPYLFYMHYHLISFRRRLKTLLFRTLLIQDNASTLSRQ
jgi:hypothetical protein